MNKIPIPFLKINFKPIINNDDVSYLYNSKDNLKEHLKMIEKSIINNLRCCYKIYFFNQIKIVGIPIGIDDEYLYLENNISIKIMNIQKIREE